MGRGRPESAAAPGTHPRPNHHGRTHARRDRRPDHPDRPRSAVERGGGAAGRRRDRGHGDPCRAGVLRPARDHRQPVVRTRPIHRRLQPVPHRQPRARPSPHRRPDAPRFRRDPFGRCHLLLPGTEKPTVEGVDLSLVQGEVIALVDENGSGKTTLARLLAGLYRPTAGTIAWGGPSPRGG
ncbi:ATP-binding cassette domain-containing protein [Actinomadura sp. WMMB 499]|uniref:ATP-binding cassette domain-containing protein n=1 Tax=Actinomadura sp. WMMB 499 TaxID=1219491 RepID=UPI00159D863D|nr:ATP-binding cassette domain-containing protein [Actinomadura sp. WMMB 499]